MNWRWRAAPSVSRPRVRPPTRAGPASDRSGPAAWRAGAAAQPAAFPETSLDPDIPAPGEVIGHEIGAAAVRYEALVRYLHALDDASDGVTLRSYARTHEGRELYYLTITSPANHARLDAIRADNAKLADPRMLDDSGRGADAIIADGPGVAWMAYAIHGDELSSTDPIGAAASV